jgi:hypothetical protein
MSISKTLSRNSIFEQQIFAIFGNLPSSFSPSRLQIRSMAMRQVRMAFRLLHRRVPTLRQHHRLRRWLRREGLSLVFIYCLLSVKSATFKRFGIACCYSYFLIFLIYFSRQKRVLRRLGRVGLPVRRRPAVLWGGEEVRWKIWLQGLKWRKGVLRA